jgi:hypothetical protein
MRGPDNTIMPDDVNQQIKLLGVVPRWIDVRFQYITVRFQERYF